MSGVRGPPAVTPAMEAADPGPGPVLEGQTARDPTLPESSATLSPAQVCVL